MFRSNDTQTGQITVANPAAAVTVNLGFTPRYVKAVNINDLAVFEYFEGMAAGAALRNGNHASEQNSVISSNGITVSDGGFTLGTAICDTAADVVRWIAVR